MSRDIKVIDMKRFRISLMLVVAAVAAIISQPSYSQIYEGINTLQSVITPALSGSGKYKGFVEAGYSHTLSHYNGDFIELTTSQGYQYNNWFFMGAGMGIDLLFAHKSENWGMNTWPSGDRGATSKAVMLPLFTDFRFLIGAGSSVSFFLDLKVGCSFLLSNKMIEIGNGYLTNREYFFLDPAIGLRLPVNKKKPKQAFDVGIRYKLLTSNYWYNANNNITLQSLGAFVGFEW